jgi:hypothetical protein
MCCGPQLEVLDPVVHPITVAVMNHLVGPKCAPEMLSHDESMLSDPPDSTHQPSLSTGNRDHPVPVVLVTVTGHFADWTSDRRIAGGKEPPVMGRAESERFVSPAAVGHRTEPAR